MWISDTGKENVNAINTFNKLFLVKLLVSNYYKFSYTMVLTKLF